MIGTAVRITNRVTSFTVTFDRAAIDLEQVFLAANRISETDRDIDNLPTYWQKLIRQALDANESPSLSVGDAVEVFDGSTVTGAWLVANIGFTPLLGGK